MSRKYPDDPDAEPVDMPREIAQGTVLMLLTQAINDVYCYAATEADVLELLTNMVERFKIPEPPQVPHAPVWDTTRYKKD